MSKALKKQGVPALIRLVRSLSTRQGVSNTCYTSTVNTFVHKNRRGVNFSLQHRFWGRLCFIPRRHLEIGSFYYTQSGYAGGLGGYFYLNNLNSDKIRPLREGEGCEKSCIFVFVHSGTSSAHEEPGSSEKEAELFHRMRKWSVYGLFNPLFVMDWKSLFISFLLVLFIPCAWFTELPPPKGIEVKSSVLSWTFSGSEDNVTYSVQYSTDSQQEWHAVCGCNQRHFNFTAASEDFYGKKFRVRAERANQTSVWKESKPVKCLQTATCAPLLNLTVKTDKVLLWMDHRDSSLTDQHASLINLSVVFWKATNVNERKKRPSSGKTLTIEGLESGQEYCFQAVYSLHRKSYGNPSRELCRVIPETSAERNRRVIISCVLLVAGLAVFGSCLYFIYKNYKRIKTFLQPPLDIPEHYHEFFSREFPEHRLNWPTSQTLEPENLVTFVSEELKEEEEAEVK